MIVIDHTGIYKVLMIRHSPCLLPPHPLMAILSLALLLCATVAMASVATASGPGPVTSLSDAGQAHPALEQTAPPALFRAIYKADYKGLPVRAEGIRALSQRADGSYLLSSEATSFLASVKEQSTFRLGERNQLVPLEYRYQRKGIGKNRAAILNFDWETHRVLNNVQSVPWSMDLPEGALDKLLYQLQIRVDMNNAQATGAPWPVLEYEVADGGRLKTYRFDVVGEEVIDTPVGKLNTVKVIRVREDSDRETSIWLAPDFGFLLVRLVQTENDKDGLELLLESAEFDGETVRGVQTQG